MPEIANPMDALLTLQPAIDQGEVTLRRCASQKGLWILVDLPNGEPRTTYVVRKKGLVQCIVQFVPADPIDGVPCLSTGYATIEAARKRGLASATLTQAIDDMRAGLRKHGVHRFYVEAIVSQSNVPSQKVAERVLGPAANSATDHFSGEPIYQYVKLFD
jgi:hypothetical protein